MIKVHDTVEGLCGTCRHSHIIQQRNRTTVYCRADLPPIRLAEPVTKCNEWEHASTPTKWEFEQIAWILKTTSGRIVGFEPPKKEQPE